MRGRRERRSVLDPAGGPADQLPGHVPPRAGAVEPQCGRLAAYLVTRSWIVRQIRLAWWAVFGAAAAVLGVEVAIFEATGDGLPDLLRLHIHPWWLLAHGYRIGSLVTWPMLVFACQAPLGIPVGAMVGALGVARGERLAAGADWSPYSQRQALVAEVHAVRQVARATRRHHEPTNPTRTPALGIAYPGGDLYPWLRKRGRSIEVVIPAREQRLAMAVLGIPGSGKTVTLLRRVWIAARAGMRVVFVDRRAPIPGWPGRSPAPTASPTRAPSSASGPPSRLTCGGETGWPSRIGSWRWRTGPQRVGESITGAWPPWPSNWPVHPQAAPLATAVSFCAAWTSRSCSSCGAATQPPSRIWSSWPPNHQALGQPEQAPLLALASSSDDGRTTEPAGVPALPATPRPRILLALQRAVAARDEATIAAVLQVGQREQPSWDPTAELDRPQGIRRWRRWRRRPVFP
jgi:hypothetical protein